MPVRGPLLRVIAVLCPREGSGLWSPKPSPGWREGGAWRGMTSEAGTWGWRDGQFGAAVSQQRLRGVRASGFVSSSRKRQSLE